MPDARALLVRTRVSTWYATWSRPRLYEAQPSFSKVLAIRHSQSIPHMELAGEPRSYHRIFLRARGASGFLSFARKPLDKSANPLHVRGSGRISKQAVSLLG